MRFAADPRAISAMSIYSGYRPDESIALSQEGLSRQRQNAIIAEGSVLANSLLNEAELDAADSQGQQLVDSVPGYGQQALMGGLRGLTGAAQLGAFNRVGADLSGQPFDYDDVVFGKISDPTADIQRALGDGVPFGMSPSAIR